MKGDIFCGINLKWDYSKLTVRLIMPDYAQLALERFQHFRATEKLIPPMNVNNLSVGSNDNTLMILIPQL